MLTVSETYNTLIASPNHWFEASICIGNTQPDNGYKGGQLISVKTSQNLFSDKPEVGKCVSGELEVSMFDPGVAIPRMAKVRPYVRATNGTTNSEWLPQGVYYIDTRETTKNSDGRNVFTFHCYDAMLKTEADYPSTSHSWPMEDIDVVEEIAETIGVNVDSRTEDIITEGYSVGLPAGYSMREVLSNIAAMYAGNWVMSFDGELRLITLTELPEETNHLIDSVYDAITFGGGNINVNDTDSIVIGDAEHSVALQTLTTAINAVQSGSGNPGPDNVRPISGFSSIKIWDEVRYNPLAMPTVEISIPSTPGVVYGGTLDVLSGILTLDKEYVQFDGTENWIRDSGGYMRMRFSTSTSYVVNDAAICSHLTENPDIASSNNLTGFRVYNKTSGTPKGATYLLRFDKSQTLSAFEQYLAEQYANGTPVQIVYTLSTPVVYQLTAYAVSTLVGKNYFWSNSGDITVSYSDVAEVIKILV